MLRPAFRDIRRLDADSNVGLLMLSALRRLESIDEALKKAPKAAPEHLLASMRDEVRRALDDTQGAIDLQPVAYKPSA